MAKKDGGAKPLQDTAKEGDNTGKGGNKPQPNPLTPPPTTPAPDPPGPLT